MNTPPTQVQSSQEQYVNKSTQSSIANIEHNLRHEKRQVTAHKSMNFEHRQRELEVIRTTLPLHFSSLMQHIIG